MIMSTIYWLSALKNGDRLRWLLSLLILLLAAGCAAPAKKTDKAVSETPASGQVTPAPPEKAGKSGPGASLFGEAEKALAAGRASEAEILLERALRLEPRNPLYWHTLGQAKFNQRKYVEAVQFCRKAETLLGKGQGELANRNKALQTQAKIAGKLP